MRIDRVGLFLIVSIALLWSSISVIAIPQPTVHDSSILIINTTGNDINITEITSEIFTFVVGSTGPQSVKSVNITLVNKNLENIIPLNNSCWSYETDSESYIFWNTSECFINSTHNGTFKFNVTAKPVDSDTNQIFQIYTNDTSNMVSSLSEYINVLNDLTPPFVGFNLSTTSNDTWYVQDWILINITAYDVNMDSVLLYWNSSFELFQNSLLDVFWSNKTNLPDGEYSFYAYATDTNGNSNETGIYSIYLDTTYPKIDFKDPTLSNGAFSPNNFIEINTSILEENIIDFVYYIYNETSKIFEINNIQYLNYSNLSDGTYYYNTTVTDVVGLKNKTETRKITIDTVSPEINLLTKNNSYFNSLVLIEGNASDLNPYKIEADDVRFAVNYSNFSYWNITNTHPLNLSLPHTVSESVSDTIKITAIDKAGNTKDIFYTFNFDDIPPLLTDVGPSGTMTGIKTTLKVKTVNDSSYCRYSTLDISFDNMTNEFPSNPGEEHTKEISLDYGDFTYYISCRDLAGNENYTNTSFTLIEAPPSSGGGSSFIQVPTPSSLTATPGDGDVLLSWSGQTSNYKIYRSSGSGFSVIRETSSTSYVDSGLTNGVTYSYYVKGYDNNGRGSAPSNTASATPTSPEEKKETPKPEPASEIVQDENIQTTDTNTSQITGRLLEIPQITPTSMAVIGSITTIALLYAFRERLPKFRRKF